MVLSGIENIFEVVVLVQAHTEMNQCKVIKTGGVLLPPLTHRVLPVYVHESKIELRRLARLWIVSNCYIRLLDGVVQMSVHSILVMAHRIVMHPL